MRRAGPWSRRRNGLDRKCRGRLRYIGPGKGRKFGNGLEDTVGTPLEVNCPEGKRDHPGVPGVSDPSHNVM